MLSRVGSRAMDAEKGDLEKAAPTKALRWGRPAPRDEPTSLRAKAARLLRRLTHASTGSLSDGLRQMEGSESSASVNWLGGNVPAQPVPDDDWVVDAIVVDQDHDAPAAALGVGATVRNGTQTGTRSASDDRGSDTGSINGSLRHADDRDRRQGGWIVWRLLRAHLWPACRDFFEPRFEDEAVDAEFQKARKRREAPAEPAVALL